MFYFMCASFAKKNMEPFITIFPILNPRRRPFIYISKHLELNAHAWRSRRFSFLWWWYVDLLFSINTVEAELASYGKCHEQFALIRQKEQAYVQWFGEKTCKTRDVACCMCVPLAAEVLWSPPPPVCHDHDCQPSWRGGTFFFAWVAWLAPDIPVCVPAHLLFACLP